MRARILAAVAIVLAGPGCTGEPAGEVEGGLDDAPAGAEAEAADEVDLPTEVDEAALQRWEVRLDDAGASADFQMVEEGDGWRITTGPAGITWRPSDLVATGDYTARATFQEMSSEPGHREAYGLVVGGLHLDAPDQEYTYFLVRGTGDYLIKRRSGEETPTLVDWTPSEALNAIEESGARPSNTLEVRVRGDSVEFVVNDQVVETLPAERVRPYGLVGLRVNHRLDLEVTDFAVEGSAVGQGS